MSRLRNSVRASQGADPMTRYGCIYRAKVTGQSSDLQRVSVRPFDGSLPSMADIPLRHGIPGAKVQVAPGCTIQVGWDDRRPDQPFAALWSADASALRVIFDCPSIELGTENATDFVAKGTTQTTHLVAAFTAIATALTSLGKASEAATVTSEAAQLALALSTQVRVG